MKFKNISRLRKLLDEELEVSDNLYFSLNTYPGYSSLYLHAKGAVSYTSCTSCKIEEEDLEPLARKLYNLVWGDEPCE